MKTDPDPLPDHRLGGFCLYVLVDPRDGKIFYVGKCRNAKTRAQQHLRGPLPKHQRNLAARLAQLRNSGVEPEFHAVAQIKLSKQWLWGGSIALAAERQLISWMSMRCELENISAMPKDKIKQPADPAQPLHQESLAEAERHG